MPVSWQPVPTDFDELLLRIWQQLGEACGNGNVPWGIAHLATISERGPEQRIVILRKTDPASRLIVAHTDVRSPKVEQIQQDPRVQWLFFDWMHKVQLLARGTARIHVNDEIAEQAWAAAPQSSRRIYLAPQPPSAHAADPSRNLPEWAQSRIPGEEELAAGRPHFAVIQTVITEFDILFIEPQGSLRARFDWDGRQWQGSWVEP